MLDFRTQTGIAGAEIQFRGDSQARARFGEGRATTDARGSYVMPLPVVGSFTAWVDGAFVGNVRVAGSTYLGDLLVTGGTCVSRYGTLADSGTLKPVAGATVSMAGGMTVSGPDGWYRIDLGCPVNGSIGSGTTVLHVAHPNYAPRDRVVGRGVQGVLRLDLELERR